MNRKSILLLGGGGFIGSALARRLKQGKYVVHIVNLQAESSVDPDLIVHRGSMDDRGLLEELLPECGTLIHLASATTPGDSADHPLQEATANIGPSLRLLEVLEEIEIPNLIYFSSGGTLYGNPKDLPVNEDYSLSPISYHGAGKWAIEAFLRVYASRPGRSLVILRPSNLYGPGQSVRQGFGVIRTMLDHLRFDTEMKIWGRGNTVRDFLFIDDMVDVCARLLDRPGEQGIYNVGSGIGHSLNQLKEIIERVCGKKLRVVYSPERRGDVRSIVLDCSRLMAHLDWRPAVSLEEGIHLTWKWLQDL